MCRRQVSQPGSPSRACRIHTLLVHRYREHLRTGVPERQARPRNSRGPPSRPVAPVSTRREQSGRAFAEYPIPQRSGRVCNAQRFEPALISAPQQGAWISTKASRRSFILSALYYCSMLCLPKAGDRRLRRRSCCGRLLFRATEPEGILLIPPLPTSLEVQRLHSAW